jgi:hypothetical protein
MAIALNSYLNKLS